VPPSAGIASDSWSWNFGFDQLPEQLQRFLPAEIARFDRDRAGYAFLHDADLRSDGNLLQRDRVVHLAGQVRVVEPVRVANLFVRHQLEVGAAERMRLPVAQV